METLRMEVWNCNQFLGIHEAWFSQKSQSHLQNNLFFLLQTLPVLVFLKPRVIKVTILQTVWRWWSFSMLTALVQVLMQGLRLGLTNSPWAKPYKLHEVQMLGNPLVDILWCVQTKMNAMIRIHMGSSSVYWIKLVGWYPVGTMNEKNSY